MQTLLLLSLLAALFWLWLDGARAREFATTLARRYCDHRDMQFLDDTVALARIGVRWGNDGIRIRRMFRFDFSLEGVGRRTGHVLMLGTSLETIDDGLPRQDEDSSTGQETRPEGDRKVIPFRRKEH